MRVSPRRPSGAAPTCRLSGWARPAQPRSTRVLRRRWNRLTDRAAARVGPAVVSRSMFAPLVGANVLLGRIVASPTRPRRYSGVRRRSDAFAQFNERVPDDPLWLVMFFLV